MAENKNEFLPYKVVYQDGHGEYEEKKSRFIASVIPVSSEEEAVAFIDSVRKKYYDARHHCSALYRVKQKKRSFQQYKNLASFPSRSLTV